MPRMQPGRTGYTVLDGVVEAHQRSSDAPVLCVLVTTGDYPKQLAPGSPMDRLYGLLPHVRHVTEASDAACREVLCYCPQADSINFGALGCTEMPMLGTVELRCGRKLSPAPAR